MVMFDFSRFYAKYPAIIAQMPTVFNSHQFILELAHQNQIEYIKALYAYRGALHNETPAPFQVVHRILSARLNDFPELVKTTRSHKPSRDIFGNYNTCSEWRKLS
jgi:hypothetical protein